MTLGPRPWRAAGRWWLRAAGRARHKASTAVFVHRRFDDLPLDARVLAGVAAVVGEGARLTRVQDLAFRRLLPGAGSASAGQEGAGAPGGRTERPDVLLRAGTGTGKSLAFLVPAVQRLAARERAGELKPGVSVLVLAPTRELVLQLTRVAQALLQRLSPRLRASFVAGGFALREDVARLRADAPHVLVATPGRLTQHLEGTPNFVRALQSVDTLVLDEADRLLDNSFVYQTDYVNRCLPATPRPQTILCSATFGEDVRRFAARSMRADFAALDVAVADPELGLEHSPPQAGAAPAEGAALADAAGANRRDEREREVVELVQQVLVRYEAADFVAVFLATLARELHSPDGEARRVLVLFPTVRWLQFFYALLKHQGRVEGLWALHSHLSDDRRRSRAGLFARGAAQAPTRGALFATDVAARGLDFDVHAVIQVGPPADRREYVHRAGRTGRLTTGGRSLLLLNALEEQGVLRELEGLDLNEEPPPSLSEGGPWNTKNLAKTYEALDGWWREPHLSASGDIFFSSAISYYLGRRERFGAGIEDIVRLAASLLRSAGYPADRGLPAVPAGLVGRLKGQDELLGIRAASARERFDVLCSLPAYPGFRAKQRAQDASGDAGGEEADALP